VIERLGNKLPSPSPRIRRALLYAAVVWLVGIQAYFYVDLLIERRDQVSSVLNRLRDLFS
jgi:hypothetical protein